MCLILLSLNAHPDYSLIVAANRDEYYSRPSAQASFIEGTSILAGQDLVQGGAWTGITKNGRFDAVTNYRDPADDKADVVSRGGLVYNYLAFDICPEKYLEDISRKADRYNGFNLIAGTINELYYYSNRENIIRKIEDGIHVLSNSLLDVPWPKSVKARQMFTECLTRSEVNTDSLFDVLSDTERPPDEELPVTGVGLEFERMLSSVFVQSPDYGTKASTLVLADRSRHVKFAEKSYLSYGKNARLAVFEFDVKE